MACCFPVQFEHQRIGKKYTNNSNKTGTGMFGKRIFLTIALYCTAVAMTVVAQSALAFTITRTSAPSVALSNKYPGKPHNGHYAAYRITNNGGSSFADVWATIGSFSGPAIATAPGEDGLVQLGEMAPGESKMAYFYLVTTADSGATEDHTVRVYTSRPSSPTASGAVDSASFSLDKTDSLQANSNKVTTIVSGPTPPILGGIVTIEVTGDTGTIANSRELSFTPAIRNDWPADVYQVMGSSIVLSGGNNKTLTDDLFEVVASKSNTNYVATYTLRAISATTAPAVVSPIAHIASGASYKYAGNDFAVEFPPIVTPQNRTTLTKTVNNANLTGAGSVTYTLTLTNASSTDVTIDSVVDTLPSSPDTVVYRAGTSTYNGSPIADPAGSGVHVWTGPFAVPANSSVDLTFEADIPATAKVSISRASASSLTSSGQLINLRPG